MIKIPARAKVMIIFGALDNIVMYDGLCVRNTLLLIAGCFLEKLIDQGRTGGEKGDYDNHQNLLFRYDSGLHLVHFS